MSKISAKQIRIGRIDSASANAFIKSWHYSGKVVQNSKLHFGAFLDGKLHGVLSFGSSLDKSKTIGLVKGTEWHEFMELNRLAFDPFLPKNSESRCIAVCMRLIKKSMPFVKWILSYADGTIYRAAGFVLTGIKKNTDLFLLPDGNVLHSMTVKSSKKLLEKYGNYKVYLNTVHPGWKPLEGFQLRYIYFLDKAKQKDLAVKELPFTSIKEKGAKMYLGKRAQIV